MYSRIHEGEVLDFGHEGVLYRNSFVMYDQQTRSLWVHTTGEAIKGPMRGAGLTFIPSEVVTWEVWKERYPETLVLDRGGEDTGFMGTFTLSEEAEEFGFSVGSGTKATLFAVTTLKTEGLIEERDQLAVYLKDSETFRAYAREGRSFRLDGAGRLTDASGSQWDAITGESMTAGGIPLTRLPATPWLIRRWKKFYPDSVVVEGDEDH